MSATDGSARNITRDARLSVRVPTALKERLQDVVAELHARGQRTTESELVELLVADGLDTGPEGLDDRLRQWRMTQEGPR